MPNHQYLVTEAKQWLQKHLGWLLLLDNVEEDVQVKDILAGMPHGHVLLTTRSQAVAELAVCSLLEYIQLYHKHRKELLARRSERQKLYANYKE